MVVGLWWTWLMLVGWLARFAKVATIWIQHSATMTARFAENPATIQIIKSNWSKRKKKSVDNFF